MEQEVRRPDPAPSNTTGRRNHHAPTLPEPTFGSVLLGVRLRETVPDSAKPTDPTKVYCNRSTETTPLEGRRRTEPSSGDTGPRTLVSATRPNLAKPRVLLVLLLVVLPPRVGAHGTPGVGWHPEGRTCTHNHPRDHQVEI